MADDKLPERLQISKINRLAVIRQFGFVPMSILKIGRGKLHRSMFHYAGDMNISANTKNNNLETLKKLAAEGCNKNSALQKGIGRGKPGFSIMPAELVEFFVKYYAKKGEVYLDPFMGQGIQMQVAHLMGLHYYGYDLSKEFCEYIYSVKGKIEDGTTLLITVNGDSRYPTEIPDNVGDFSFYSPPYWDIEIYGDEPGQLGPGQSYDEFLLGMEEVAKAWYPKFKKGAWHAVNVGDFRKDGKFYAYHADIIRHYINAGWVLNDIWIIEGLANLPRAHGVQLNMKRIAPKVHEYVLVFRKP